MKLHNQSETQRWRDQKVRRSGVLESESLGKEERKRCM